jgi:hypothetical protein
MYHGEDVLFNDEQRVRLREASRQADLAWRFRNVKRPSVRILSGVVEGLSDAIRAALAALPRETDAARRGGGRTHDRRPQTLIEQH